MTDTNIATGILGNTQSAAAAEATSQRQETKASWKESAWTHVGIAVTLAVIAVLLLNGLQWDFFLKLMTGFAVFWTGGKLAKWMGEKLVWHWAGIFRGTGALILIIALAQSGFYSLFRNKVNAIENRATIAAGGTATNPVPARTVLRTTWMVGEVYVIHPGEVYEGIIPDAGIVFDQPAGWGITAIAHNGDGGVYEPAGTQKADPWGRVKVIPLPADRGKVFTVTASQ
jgi:hypothetical protein